MILSALVYASIYWPGDGLVPKNDTATSSGEAYNARSLTCAHKTLPFGTCLYLSHGTNHVEIRINDRGPFNSRELDCTPAVDRALHLNGLGLVKVEFCPPLPREKPK